MQENTLMQRECRVALHQCRLCIDIYQNAKVLMPLHDEMSAETRKFSSPALLEYEIAAEENPDLLPSLVGTLQKHAFWKHKLQSSAGLILPDCMPQIRSKFNMRNRKWQALSLPNCCLHACQMYKLRSMHTVSTKSAIATQDLVRSSWCRRTHWCSANTV